uniref:GOLD domain-containing protein n=1 Tax=Arcella intermedia TaxID=1963864 RepID=A0A6B2LJ17_9EUKA
MQGLVVFSILISLVGISRSFMFDVPARKEVCFFEQIEEKSPVSVMFQVTSGGNLDIDVKVLGPSKKVIYSGKNEEGGRYAFVASETGAHSYCFSNAMSSLTLKEVQLVLSVGKPSKDSDVATDAEVSPLVDAMTQLMDAIETIAADQQYLKMREVAHRSTNESTNSRVVWWSLFEMGILILLSVWQIYYLRRFFEVRRNI